VLYEEEHGAILTINAFSEGRAEDSDARLSTLLAPSLTPPIRPTATLPLVIIIIIRLHSILGGKPSPPTRAPGSMHPFSALCGLWVLSIEPAPRGPLGGSGGSVKSSFQGDAMSCIARSMQLDPSPGKGGLSRPRQATSGKVKVRGLNFSSQFCHYIPLVPSPFEMVCPG
jgi:hypothetical protein